MRVQLVLQIFLLFIINSINAQISSNPVGAATGVVFYGSTLDTFTIDCNFISYESYAATSYNIGDFYATEYSLSVPKTTAIFRIVDKVPVSGSKYNLKLKLLYPASIIAFPTNNAVIYSNDTNYNFMLLDANASDNYKSASINSNIIRIDSILYAISASSVTIIDSTFIRNDSVFIAAGVNEYFTGVATGGSGSLIDSTFIQNDSVFIASGGNDYYSGLTNIVGLDSVSVSNDSIYLWSGGNSYFTGYATISDGGSFSVLDTTVTAVAYTVSLSGVQEARVIADVVGGSNNITVTLPEPDVSLLGKKISVEQTNDDTYYITINQAGIGNKFLIKDASFPVANIVNPAGIKIGYSFVIGYDANSASYIWVASKDSDVFIEDSRVTFYDPATSAKQKIKVDYEIDSIAQIVQLEVNNGDNIYVKPTGARYVVQSSAVSGYTTDTVAVVPVDGKYAVLAEKQLSPEMFGGIADFSTNIVSINVNSDTVTCLSCFVVGDVGKVIAIKGSRIDTTYSNRTVTLNATILDYISPSAVIIDSTASITAQNQVAYVGTNNYPAFKRMLDFAYYNGIENIQLRKGTYYLVPGKSRNLVDSTDANGGRGLHVYGNLKFQGLGQGVSVLKFGEEWIERKTDEFFVSGFVMSGNGRRIFSDFTISAPDTLKYVGYVGKYRAFYEVPTAERKTSFLAERVTINGPWEQCYASSRGGKWDGTNVEYYSTAEFKNDSLNANFQIISYFSQDGPTKILDLENIYSRKNDYLNSGSFALGSITIGSDTISIVDSLFSFYEWSPWSSFTSRTYPTVIISDTSYHVLSILDKYRAIVDRPATVSLSDSIEINYIVGPGHFIYAHPNVTMRLRNVVHENENNYFIHYYGGDYGGSPQYVEFYNVDFDNKNNAFEEEGMSLKNFSEKGGYVHVENCSNFKVGPFIDPHVKFKLINTRGSNATHYIRDTVQVFGGEYKGYFFLTNNAYAEFNNTKISTLTTDTAWNGKAYFSDNTWINSYEFRDPDTLDLNNFKFYRASDNILYYFNNTTDEFIPVSIINQATSPSDVAQTSTSPPFIKTKALWRDTDDGKVYSYKTSWEEIGAGYTPPTLNDGEVVHWLSGDFTGASDFVWDGDRLLIGGNTSIASPYDLQVQNGDIYQRHYITTAYNPAANASWPSLLLVNGQSTTNSYSAISFNATPSTGSTSIGSIGITAETTSGATPFWINTRNSGGTYSEKLRVDNVGSLRFNLYGSGNKEADDLSKTESGYSSRYATDGTLLEYQEGSGELSVYFNDTPADTLNLTTSYTTFTAWQLSDVYGAVSTSTGGDSLLLKKGTYEIHYDAQWVSFDGQADTAYIITGIREGAGVVTKSLRESYKGSNLPGRTNLVSVTYRTEIAGDNTPVSFVVNGDDGASGGHKVLFEKLIFYINKIE